MGAVALTRILNISNKVLVIYRPIERAKKIYNIKLWNGTYF